MAPHLYNTGQVSSLTSDHVHRHVGGLPHGGVAGVVAAVLERGRPDQQGGHRPRPPLRHLAHPAPAGAVGDRLEHFYCCNKVSLVL